MKNHYREKHEGNKTGFLSEDERFGDWFPKARKYFHDGRNNWGPERSDEDLEEFERLHPDLEDVEEQDDADEDEVLEADDVVSEDDA